jgi:hemerythrin-like domain-containing protein
MRPTDTLRAEHEEILAVLATLTSLADRGEPIERAHVDTLVAFFRGFADRCHHAKEETALFPALEARGIPRRGGPIGVMLYEHEEGRSLLQAIADAAAAGAPRDFARAAHAYEDLLGRHIHKENEILFRMAERVLGEAEEERLAGLFAGFDQAELGAGERDRLLSAVKELGRVYG